MMWFHSYLMTLRSRPPSTRKFSKLRSQTGPTKIAADSASALAHTAARCTRPLEPGHEARYATSATTIGTTPETKAAGGENERIRATDASPPIAAPQRSAA